MHIKNTLGYHLILCVLLGVLSTASSLLAGAELDTTGLPDSLSKLINGADIAEHYIPASSRVVGKIEKMVGASVIWLSTPSARATPIEIPYDKPSGRGD